MNQNQLFHDPFNPKAKKLGSYGTELSRYSACLRRWADFFIEQARIEQAAYEKSRREWLTERATKTRQTSTRKTTKKKVSKLYAALKAAGLSDAEALKIASI